MARKIMIRHSSTNRFSVYGVVAGIEFHLCDVDDIEPSSFPIGVWVDITDYTIKKSLGKDVISIVGMS